MLFTLILPLGPLYSLSLAFFLNCMWHIAEHHQFFRLFSLAFIRYEFKLMRLIIIFSTNKAVISNLIKSHINFKSPSHAFRLRRCGLNHTNVWYKFNRNWFWSLNRHQKVIRIWSTCSRVMVTWTTFRVYLQNTANIP